MIKAVIAGFFERFSGNQKNFDVTGRFDEIKLISEE
jgi:hypothetical protein